MKTTGTIKLRFAIAYEKYCGNDFEFNDIRDFYNTLSRCPTPISYAKFIKIVKYRHDQKTITQDDCYNSHDLYHREVSSPTWGMSGNSSRTTILQGGDAYYGIEILGGTYGKLECGLITINFVIGERNRLILPDFTDKNPLFNISNCIIRTDSMLVKYYAVVISSSTVQATLLRLRGWKALRNISYIPSKKSWLMSGPDMYECATLFHEDDLEYQTCNGSWWTKKKLQDFSSL